MSRIVFVNGEYVAEQHARISVFDRGFVFGDGVYEVVPVIHGKMVDKQYFIERLRRSLAELQIAWPCSEAEYLEVMRQIIQRNKLQEGMVYTQVTRGVADRNFAFPPATAATMVAFTSVLQLLDNPAAETGIAVTTFEDLRWKRRDIKSVNLLAQCLAKQDAHSKGASESWMYEDGFVTEGSSSSAYIVSKGIIITRPLSNWILPGIRRRTLLDIAAQAGLTVEQRPFTIAEALSADEAFISSATTIVTAVVSVDGNRIANGMPGPITRQLRELYKTRMLLEAN